MVSRFKEALDSGKFVVTSEVAPPKGTNLEKMLHHIDILKNSVDAINVTDHQSSVMRYPSLGGCLEIIEKNAEPIMQMTCRDRNRIGLEADLLFAYRRGVRNILCLTGDAVPVGDHKEAMGVFDLDSLQLLMTIRKMAEGRDLGDNELDGTIDFCAGAIVTPEASPMEPQLIKFEKKVEAGAEFFQTQAIYDLDNFGRFMEYARPFHIKVLAGIVLLSSARMAKYMTENVPGIFVPQELIDEMASVPKEEMLAKGIEIAGRTIAALKNNSICDGVHIMAIGKEEVVPDILAAAGI
jgi:methylenetetrahydrofolate reductase (NADPH)